MSKAPHFRVQLDWIQIQDTDMSTEKVRLFLLAYRPILFLIPVDLNVDSLKDIWRLYELFYSKHTSVIRIDMTPLYIF